MMKKLAVKLALGLMAGCGVSAWAQNAPEPAGTALETAGDLAFFVLVKSNNYAQDSNGMLSLLNYHFFSELFPRGKGKIVAAKLTRVADGRELPFVDRGETFYYEGGHFDSMAEVDAEHPNGAYRFDIETTTENIENAELMLSGPGGESDIPHPIKITFRQDGAVISPDVVDGSKPLRVNWTAFSNGRADPNGIVDDMIFVVFQDCHGTRVFHTGLPFSDEHYMTYRATEVTIPPGTLKPGLNHSMFVEMPHVVESTIVSGVPGFTSYATATYLDLKTVGENEAEACPEVTPPLDTGQTDRMERKEPDQAD
jgi:hypothetical protein